MKRTTGLALFLILPSCLVHGHATRKNQPVQPALIPLVSRMPNCPEPYGMRDWKQVTRDYLDLVFGFDRKGDFLPFGRWNDTSRQTFFLPSYIGTGGPEGINCLAAVVSGSLIGEDMTRFRGRNWVQMCQAYFSREDGVYVNGIHGRVAGTFWYDLFPNVLFYQIADGYPGVGETASQFRSVADRLAAGCDAMGSKDDAKALPSFDHTAFRFENMSPVDNGRWIEPDGAAGIAWLETMAYARNHDPRYLTTADHCLLALQGCPKERNPLYEVLRKESLRVERDGRRVVDPAVSPFATGDALGRGAPTNLCLYGASHVGILGALVGKTSDPKILLIELLKTDAYRACAYPTCLLYNPYPVARTVNYRADLNAGRLYNAVTHRFVGRARNGVVTATLTAETACVLVETPPQGVVQSRRGRLLIDGVIVDYRIQ